MKVCAAMTVIMAMLLRDFGLIEQYLWLSVFTINATSHRWVHTNLLKSTVLCLHMGRGPFQHIL
jgi:hypothetical protein